jgi:uncharacterized protein
VLQQQTLNMTVCYLTPRARPVPFIDGGAGIMATENIGRGETIVAFGGTCVTRTEFDGLPESRQRRSIQIDDSLFMAGGEEAEAATCINHSCEPNCGMSGAVMLVALRDIAAGEPLTYDYAMSDGSDYDEFECLCGTAACRGKITGADWMLPELQLRYRGNFSPYLARRISDLVCTGAERRAFAL